MTKEITKSSKYKIESGVALEVGSITQGLASSMTAKYTRSTKYTGPTTKGTNTREYRVKFYRHKRKQIEYRKITNTKLKEENIDILKIYFCPHNEKDHCHCKKPKPGMIEQAKKDFLIDMNNSIYIGDSQVDYLLAKHFTLTFYGINYNGDNVKSYRGILEISKQIKKIQNK